MRSKDIYRRCPSVKKRIIALSTTAALLSTIFVTPASASTYTVKKGDTLTKIANKFNVTTQTLKKLNKLTSDKLLVNQKIETSASIAKKSGQATVTLAQTKTQTYTVVAGDTLTKIANKLNLTLAELKELNPKLTNKVYIGSTIHVSKTASKAVIDIPNATKTKLPSSTYTVEPGDSLSTIAKKTNTSIAELKVLNKLTSSTIKIGQTLKIGNAIRGVNKATSAMIESTNVSISPKIDSVISEAKKVIGTPYVWAGTNPGGFDCSGLVYYSFKQAGYEISRHSASTYYNLGDSITSPKAGDLIFFATGSNRASINHMGIYLGNDQFIHASSSKGVQISSLTTPYYQDKLIGYKRLAL